VSASVGGSADRLARAARRAQDGMVPTVATQPAGDLVAGVDACDRDAPLGLPRVMPPELPRELQTRLLLRSTVIEASRTRR